jgi:hypothetical protein|tara:strand:+ start:30 stop:476 length:447 start_codon:yes stop_codon:yes gene_type:complete
MSSLNINDLYGTIHEKNIKRLEHFDCILQKIHSRIRASARKEETHCFYQVPEFIIGVPLYNVLDLRKYLINSLEKNGFKLLYMEPNWLFISWEVKQPTINDSLRKQKSDGKKLKSQEFKTIDDYKPNGNFVYNLNDIQVMKNKTINLL